MNNNGSACTIARSLLEGYVLDILDPVETAAVKQHLAACPDCAAEAAAQREILNNLPQLWATVSQIKAPPSLKARVLANIALAPEVKTPVSQVRSWQRPKHAQGWQLAFWAALIVLVGILAQGRDMNRQSGDSRLEQQRLLIQFEAEPAILGVINSQQTTIQLLAPPTTSKNDPWGKYYSRPERKDIVITGWDMPPLPPDYTYYAWLRSEEELILAGTMAVDNLGFGWVYFDGEQLPQAYEGVGFTMQPIGETESNRQAIIRWQAER